MALFVYFAFRKFRSRKLKGKSTNFLWPTAIMLVLAAWTAGLFIDLTGDAGLYAAISRQMIQAGDWFNLSINGQAYDQKPHLLFWLAGAGISFLGNTNLGYKLFPFMTGLLSLYFIYRLARLLYSSESGKWAALMAATSQIFFLYLFDIHTDTVLQAMVMLAVWQLFAYLKNQKNINYISGFMGVGLAMLTKGPVGAVLPFLVVLIYLLLKKDYRQLFNLKWLPGILIVLLVISPTLVHLYQSFGWKGIEFYFVTNNLGRISGEYAGSSSDPFYYLYNSLWMFLPWTIFVFAAVYNEVKNWFAQKDNSFAGTAILGSVFILLVVLSIAKGKAPNYFFMAVPLLFVITGKWIGKWSLEYQKKLKTTQLGLISLLWILFMVVVIFYPGGLLWVTLLVLISGGLIVNYHRRFESGLDRIIYISVIVAAILNLYVNVEMIPELAKYQGARQVLEAYHKNRQPGDSLYNMHIEEYELFYYADDKVIPVDNADDYYKMLDNRNLWLYTTKEGYEGILNNVDSADKVIRIKYRGLNSLRLPFLFPHSREEFLKEHYLIHLN